MEKNALSLKFIKEISKGGVMTKGEVGEAEEEAEVTDKEDKEDSEGKEDREEIEEVAIKEERRKNMQTNRLENNHKIRKTSSKDYCNKKIVKMYIYAGHYTKK